MTPSKMNKTRIVADTPIAVSLPANKSQLLLINIVSASVEN